MEWKQKHYCPRAFVTVAREYCRVTDDIQCTHFRTDKWGGRDADAILVSVFIMFQHVASSCSGTDLDLYSGHTRFIPRLEWLATLTEVLPGFPQSLQQRAEKVPSNMRSPPTKSSPPPFA